MFDLAGAYHDYLDRIEKNSMPPDKCPVCDGTGRTRADYGWVRCRWCNAPDYLEAEAERAIARRLYPYEEGAPWTRTK